MSQACNKCGEIGEPLIDFARNRKECKKCVSIRSREWNLVRKYGMTLQDYNNMLEDQEYSCAICGVETTSHRYGVFNVDHCHETGKVRALLCNSCNTGLGQFKDNTVLLERASDYIKYWKEK